MSPRTPTSGTPHLKVLFCPEVDNTASETFLWLFDSYTVSFYHIPPPFSIIFQVLFKFWTCFFFYIKLITGTSLVITVSVFLHLWPLIKIENSIDINIFITLSFHVYFFQPSIFLLISRLPCTLFVRCRFFNFKFYCLSPQLYWYINIIYLPSSLFFTKVILGHQIRKIRLRHWYSSLSKFVQFSQRGPLVCIRDTVLPRLHNER